MIKPVNIACGFAILVTSINWHWKYFHQQEHSTSRFVFDGAGCVIVFCIIFLVFVLGVIYRHFRKCLSQNILIPNETKFINFWPCLWLTPLLFRTSSSSIQELGNNSTIIISSGYGSDLSIYALMVSILTIIVYQVFINIFVYTKSLG